MQKKWLSILLLAPLMQSNYALADQAEKKELDYKNRDIKDTIKDTLKWLKKMNYIK